MATITPIQLLNRIGAPGAPLYLSAGELAYNQPDAVAVEPPVDVLYVGNGTSLNVLVGSARQVELWGDQLITGNKTIDVSNLKLNGGAADYLLTTDGAGNLSWTNAPGGGLTQVATDGVTLSGLGTSASPLAVVPETVPVAVDNVTIGGNGTSAPLHVFANTVTVATDGVTIQGTGTLANPLNVIPHGTAIATTGGTLSGNGTSANPLAVVANSVPVATNATLAGNGTTASPLGVVTGNVAIVTDGLTITGNGTTGNPLKAVDDTVAVVTDGVTIGGSGVTGSPLHVLPNSVTIATSAPITGNGTTASPFGLNTPLALQYGGTGVNASSNAVLLNALGAASTAQVAAGYVALAGSSMTGALNLSGNAPSGANLQAVPLQQMTSAVAAVSTYNATAPTSPNIGALWFNPTTSVLQIWSGTAWVTVVPSPVVTEVTLQGDATGSAP